MPPKTKHLDAVADELYGLPPDEFTAVRTRAEKQARDLGDRELAAEIRALAKPNATAWLLNQLAREHRKELLPLLDLGAELREATRELAGDRLRELSKRQQELVQALQRRVRELATTRGQSVSDSVVRGIQETLHAALVDEQAAEQLLTGRLSTTLQRSGLGDGIDPAPAARKKPAKRVAAKQPKAAPVVDQSRVKAERALAAATKARDEAQAKAAAADEAADAAQGEVDRLRAELEAARAASAKAEKARRERNGALRRAERALEDAARRTPAG